MTGGARGIGAATARLAAGQGYAVAVNYERARERAETLVAEIEAAGGQAIAVQADVAREDQVERMFGEVDAAPRPPQRAGQQRRHRRRRRDPGRRARADQARAPPGGQRDRHHAVLPRGGAPDVDRARRRRGCHRQRLLDGGDHRRPRRPHRLCGLQGGDRQLHDRARQGGRARGHPGQRAPARHDAHRHDRRGAPGCRAARPDRRHDRDQPLRRP